MCDKNVNFSTPTTRVLKTGIMGLFIEAVSYANFVDRLCIKGAGAFAGIGVVILFLKIQ